MTIVAACIVVFVDKSDAQLIKLRQLELFCMSVTYYVCEQTTKYKKHSEKLISM